MSRTLLLTTLLFAFTASAQIYKTTDEHGNVVFTDSPPADSASTQKIEVRQPNTAPAPASQAAPPPASEPAEQEVTTYEVAITAPANETTIPNGPGNFSVTGSVKPSLSTELALQLFMDGEPRGEPQRSTTWDLVNVFRGAHSLTIGVVDQQGKSIAVSDAVTVFVHRPSINFRNN
jgi:hypothetical protein